MARKTLSLTGNRFRLYRIEELEEFCDNIVAQLRNSRGDILPVADCLPARRFLIKFNAGDFRSGLIKAHSFGFDDWYGIKILKAIERARLTLPHRFAHANLFEFENADALLKEHPFKPYKVESPSILRFEEDKR